MSLLKFLHNAAISFTFFISLCLNCLKTSCIFICCIICLLVQIVFSFMFTKLLPLQLFAIDWLMMFLFDFLVDWLIYLFLPFWLIIYLFISAVLGYYLSVYFGFNVIFTSSEILQRIFFITRLRQQNNTVAFAISRQIIS